MDKPADDLELWRAGARELMPMVVALRRELHKFPELGLHLPETTRRAREALAGLDVEIADSTTTTSLIVTLRGAQQGPTILLRGDMDALPMPEDTDLEFKSQNEGRMHACGHDSHTAMLVGAVHLLHRHRDRLNGNVKFFFQTGEEGYAGARHVIEEGMLGVAPVPNAAFAIHISPNIPAGVIATRPGPLMAATDTIHIEIVGRGGHASQPHYTLDPIPAACEIVTALQSLVTRRIEAFDPVVLSITKIEAGTTSNVVPENAKLLGTLRSFSEKSRTKAREGIERIAEGIAKAHGLEARVESRRGLSGHDQRRQVRRIRARRRHQSAGRPWVSQDAGADHGRRGFFLCVAADAGLHGVPGRCARRRLAPSRACLPFQPHDDGRERDGQRHGAARRHRAPVSGRRRGLNPTHEGDLRHAGKCGAGSARTHGTRRTCGA